MARYLILAGLALVALGLVLWGWQWLAAQLPPDHLLRQLRPGRLPGDIHIERDGYSFHFPLMTCLVVSAVLSLLFYLFKK